MMKKIGDFIKTYWITILIFLSFFVWYHSISSRGNNNKFLFPPFSHVLKAFAEDWKLMFVNLFASAGLMIPSVLIALAIAIIGGTILGMNEAIRIRVYPVIYAVSVVPAILMSPFALLLTPTFRAASLFLIIYNTLWPTMFATMNGITTIDKRYLDNAATLELSRSKKIFRVMLPAAMPSITSGIITSLQSSFLVLVFAEMYGAHYGMGYYVKKNSEYGMYAKTWAGFIFMVLVLVIVMQTFERLKNRSLKWTIQ